MARQAIAGAGAPTNANQGPEPGSLFGWPMYGTQPRLVVDNGNSALGATPLQGSQVPLNTTRLDQLDIVRGMKLLFNFAGTWTHGSGKTLTVSPLAPANIITGIQFQLQAAYNTMHLPGWLAAAFQAFRPSWGDRGLGPSTPDTFAVFDETSVTLAGDESDVQFIIDVPFAIKLDEYFDLSAEGVPVNRYGESLVGVQYMAAQSKVVVPTITIASQLSINDLYNSPVSGATGDTTSTFADGSVSASLYRDAFWTGQNPASNPPEYAWLYTRDYFVQPTSGQGAVNALIQNTGVSVGQVLSLVAMIWDPAANDGLGGPVLIDSIQSWQLITGGTLQNWATDPALVQDRMRSLYGNTTAGNLINSGIFVFDFCLSEDGSYLTNANAINTYVVNGVQLSAIFASNAIPGASAKMYVGVEALKMATS